MTVDAPKPAPDLSENAYGVLVTRKVTDDIVDLATEKYDAFLPKAKEILDNADVIISSLDLDGVIFDKYTEEKSEPIINAQELKTIPIHLRRINRAMAGDGKKAYSYLNTNREGTILKTMMHELDPDNSQGHMAAVLEGGHMLGYQIDKKLLNVAEVDEATGIVRYADGGVAHIIEETPQGQVMLSESLLEAPHLRDIRLGKEGLSVAQAREVLNKTFEARHKELGDKAWMPEGREGMVTVRGVDQAQMVAEVGQDISKIKKHVVPEGAPIVKMVREILSLGENERLEDMPFELIYYPFDGGFDIQFKGLNKTFGQKALVARMKSLGVISEDARVAILHNGDSGSDGIEFEDEALKTTCIVLAVANSDKGLIGKSSLLATYPHRKGVRQGLYVLGSMLRGLQPAK